jgi:undecaprenyl-diphosphatase
MWMETFVLAVVEGITEYLPVSSTGHMILAKSALGLQDSEALDAFLVIVQAGAILAVVTLYFPILLSWLNSWLELVGKKKLLPNAQTLRMQSLAVALSMLPFAILGISFKPFIKTLFSYQSVSWALIVGGFFILAVEWFLKRKPADAKEKDLNDLSLRSGIVIGLGQCLALWPGFSRSAATLLTARLVGFERSAAAEVSFLLGLPTLLGAAGYETIKSNSALTPEWLGYLAMGIVVSWFTALVCVKLFVSYLKKYPISVFAYYRIVVGVTILIVFR